MKSQKEPVKVITFRSTVLRRRSANKVIFKDGKLYGPISKLQVKRKRPRGIGSRKYPIARVRTFANRQKPRASFRRDRHGR